MAKIFVEEKLKNIDLSLKNIDTSISSRAPANTALSNSIYTNARAIKLDKLDNLDVSISSRAPASTALSNTVYTSARAGNLDKLDTNVSTRARQDMLGLSTDVGGLKGLAYNENLHQKCADIIALSNDILTNINNIAIKSGGGDFNGKELVVTDFSLNIGQTWEYLNSKGGIAIIWFRVGYDYNHNLVVDGVRIMEGKGIASYWQSSGNSFNILIPFKESIKIEIISGDYNIAIDFKAYIYLNKE